MTAAAGVTVVLWFHISRQDLRAYTTILIATVIWASSLLYRYTLLLYRNLAWGRNTTTMIETSENALKLQITPARSWKVQPGQYVYLTVAKAGTLSLFQRHPYMVASPILSNSIELHIWPQDGFSKKLRRCSERYQYNAWIEGPYGRPVDLREFGTVIIIASEMGITGHLGYLRDLVEKQDDFDTKIRDVVFIWTVEEWSHSHPARKSMDELLKKDREGEETNFTKDQRYLDSKFRDRREDPGARPAPSGNNVSSVPMYGLVFTCMRYLTSKYTFERSLQI